LKIERSVEDKVSERNVELMIEGKMVNCVGLKLEKSVYSVKPESMKHQVAVNEKINLIQWKLEELV
jgi:hypothetical protein